MSELFVPTTLTQEQLSEAHDLAWQAMQDVAPTLAQNFGHAAYSVKGDDETNWVTYWDEWAQETIIRRLRQFDTSIGVLAEEGVDEKADVYWTVDPIDGTGHFVRGNEMCTTMIALVDHGTPVVSMIHDFVRNDIYSAIAQGGAFRNFRHRLEVSKRPVGAAYLAVHSDEEHTIGLHLREAIYRLGANIVQYSATGYTMLSVARGSIEALVSLNDSYGHEWDSAPGSLLIHEAGGTVRNVEIGSRFRASDLNFIASNQVAFEGLLKAVEAARS